MQTFHVVQVQYVRNFTDIGAFLYINDAPIGLTHLALMFLSNTSTLHIQVLNLAADDKIIARAKDNGETIAQLSNR